MEVVFTPAEDEVKDPAVFDTSTALDYQLYIIDQCSTWYANTDFYEGVNTHCIKTAGEAFKQIARIQELIKLQIENAKTNTQASVEDE